MVRRSDSGFSLIELMIAVTVIGILASIAIPGLLNAVERARQKRTMSDIRSMGTAIESYGLDLSHYPSNISESPVQGNLEPFLEPYFIVAAPVLDAWQRDILYGSNANGSLYTITSRGSDGTDDGGGLGTTQDFDCDILFSNGRFLKWPEGIQT